MVPWPPVPGSADRCAGAMGMFTTREREGEAQPVTTCDILCGGPNLIMLSLSSCKWMICLIVNQLHFEKIIESLPLSVIPNLATNKSKDSHILCNLVLEIFRCKHIIA